MQKPMATLGWIFLALVVGTSVGYFFPSFAFALSPLGSWVLQLIKAAATPLVFLAVLEAITRFKVEGRDFFKLLIITSINASFAIGVGLILANIFRPGQYLHFLGNKNAPALAQIDLIGAIGKQVPSSIVQPFAENNIMSAVLIALIFGFAFREAKANQTDLPLLEYAEHWISLSRKLSEIILSWIICLVPLAVLVASAKISAEHGLTPFKGLGNYIALCMLGMLIHLIFIYGAWLLFYVKMGLGHFWRLATKPVLYAFSINSSLVALPLTLDSLDKLGAGKRASTLAACVGTNLNNDGIILYEGFTLIALAQASGLDLSIGMQIFAAIYCIIAAMGVAGVPEAGIVALTLVMSNVGLPTESLAMLLCVDWILARARSGLNTSSDMVSSLILHRWINTQSLKP